MPEKTWNVEDSEFWERQGRRVANRNLWLSIPQLLCGFAIWILWSVIIVRMQDLGYPLTKDELYTLTAIAGLAGATLRIPNSFFVALSGGKNSVVLTTALLILPSLGAGIALQDRDTPYAVLAILAALCGFGGGAFASSMSNISAFFPKRAQGLALGLNAGLGNLGVSVMQLGVPIAMGFALFGPLGGAGQMLPEKAGGAEIWLQNAGLVWVLPLALLVVAGALWMDNLQNVGPAPLALARMGWILVLCLGSTGVGLYLLLALAWNMWVVLPITIVLTLVLMRYLSPATVRQSLSKQFVIFREKHNWVMTVLYVMTFGSFIGYAAAFPKLIQDVFGTLPDGSANPAAPNPLAYAWLGPLVGSLARPLGGWISDKWGGARVTHWDTVVMVIAALGAAFCIRQASGSPAPQTWFLPFLLLFLLLFITTGIGNGSTFQMVPFIFDTKLAGPVLGWTSAVAAYGSFIIPKVFGAQIQAGTPEYALGAFAAYYVVCLVLNWWYYYRKGAEIPC